MNTYDEVYIGIVVANDDPTKCERIKVVIPNLLEGPVDGLPWIVPQLGRVQGNGNGKGWFGVPSIGSQVYVEFQQNNASFPKYTGGVVSELTRVPEAAEDYPHCWGYVDAIGNKLVVNTKTGVTTSYHNSGTVTIISKDGTVNETIVKDYNVTVKGNYNVNVTGNSSMSAGGTQTVSGGGATTVSSGAAVSVAASAGLSLAGAGLSMDAGGGGTGSATLKGNFLNEGTFHSTGDLSSDGNITAAGTVHGTNIP